MILQIYVFKDKQLGCFLNPYYTDTTADNSTEHLRRYLATGEIEKVSQYKHRVLYHLGTFDDASGEINVSGVNFLLDCDDVLDARKQNNV